MGNIRKSDVIRVGRMQKKRLEGMAAASNVSVREMLDALIDNADLLGVKVERNVDFNLLIDAEHRRRVEQYMTVAEAEKRFLESDEGRERNGSKE